MWSARTRSALVGILALAIAACGGDSGSGPDDDAQLLVRNQSSFTIVELYYSACTDEAWGSDRLGNDVLTPGESRTFRLSSGCWDVYAVSNGDEVEWVEMGNEIGDGETLTFTLSDP